LASLPANKSLPPSSNHLTDYDQAHFSVYMRLLTLASDGASIEEMAKSVFGIVPAEDANRSRGMVEAHLKRANWMLTSGYKHLMPR